MQVSKRSQLKFALVIALLTGCGSPAQPQASASASPSSQAQAQSSASPVQYHLFTWLDPAQRTGQNAEQVGKCSFALLTGGDPTDANASNQLAERVRTQASLGLSGLDAQLRALPTGSKVLWSDALSFMSSLQFGLPAPKWVNQVRQIAAERQLQLSFGPEYRPLVDQSVDQAEAALPCAE